MATPPCRTKSAVRESEPTWFFFIPPWPMAIIFNKSSLGRQRGGGRSKTKSCAKSPKAFTAKNSAFDRRAIETLLSKLVERDARGSRDWFLYERRIENR